MAEIEELLPATDQGKPVESIQANEPPTEANAADKPGVGERLGNLVSGLSEKFNIPFKRGRGRPRNDGKPKKSDILFPVEPSEKLADVSGAPVVQAQIPPSTVGNPGRALVFRRAIVNAVKGAFGILKKLIRIKADAAGVDEKFTEKALASCESDPTALTDFCDSLDAVLAKYNIEPKHCEEISLIVDGGRLLAPYALLLATFNAEIKRNRVRDLMERRALEKKGENEK